MYSSQSVLSKYTLLKGLQVQAPFTLTAKEVYDLKQGVLFYSFTPAAFIKMTLNEDENEGVRNCLFQNRGFRKTNSFDSISIYC